MNHYLDLNLQVIHQLHLIQLSLVRIMVLHGKLLIRLQELI